MKLVTVVTEESKEEVGVLKEEGSVLLLKNAGFNYKDMNDLIINADAKELDKIRNAEGEVLKEGSYISSGSGSALLCRTSSRNFSIRRSIIRTFATCK